MVKHKAINNTTCECGFTTDSYRGLNAHVGNLNRNIEMQAREFAEHAHAGQFRWDGKTPYITHPDRIVELLRHWRIDDGNMLAAAYLHDVVEDTSVTLEDIKNEFNSTVAELVNELTFPEKVSDGEYHDRCEKMSEDASIIKLADIFANLTEISIKGIGGHFIKKRMKAIALLQKNL